MEQAELAFLAVPDPELRRTAERIAGRLPLSVAVIHVSGAQPLAVLEPARARGHAVGSFHPFQSFPVERRPAAFRGSLVGVDASNDALLAQLEQLARGIGARPRRVPDDQRALYHVAAVLSSNLLLGLIATAAGVLESVGWSREEALQALLPLLAGVVENISSEGLEGALIGPIRRGDRQTVEKHLAELESRGMEDAARVYRILGIATLELAVASGLDPATGRQIRQALTGPPATTGGDTR